MKAHRALMTRVLMNRYYQGAPGAFLEGIPAQAAQEILDCQTNAEKPSQAIVQPAEAISSGIHYSWLAPEVQSFSPAMQTLLLAALPESISAPLCQLLHASVSMSMPRVVKPYFLGLLYRKLGALEVLPTGFLPESPLSCLAEYQKPQLIELIDFLGMYDLSEEIRQIVDTKVLKMIYQLLSVKQQHFLRVSMHQKERMSTPPIGLKQWKGDAAQLEKVLHRRGLLRLGYALSGQHPDLLWHITRRLDTGRGHLLASHYSKKEVPGISTALLQQVLSVINFFTKMSVA